MYRSVSYASQVRESTFVEMAQISAETARRLRETRAAQPRRPQWPSGYVPSYEEGEGRARPRLATRAG